MSSREPFKLHPMDLLIAEALRAGVEGVEPSPRVWERVRHRALAWTARHRHWNWNAGPARMPEAEALSLLPTAVREGWVVWRYTLPTLRLLDYAGLMLRFGW